MTPQANRTHPERTKRLHRSHTEDIICPKCQAVERATVEHTRPWFSYVHECSKCGFIVMESDWQEAHVLHLVLTNEWYDAHASGAKDIEYRAMSPHWKRLIGDRKLTLTHVRYSRGYSSTTMIRPILSISLGNCPYEGWEGMYYRIHHPEIIPRACTSCGETTRAITKSGLCCVCSAKKWNEENGNGSPDIHYA